MSRAEERAHYRITIDVVAKSDGVNRCGDIEHHLYMSKNQLVPYTVVAEDVKYKVELLSIEAEGQAEKDLALTVEDIKTILDISFWNDDPEKILQEYNRLKK